MDFSFLDKRFEDVVAPWPKGDNSSDTVFGNVHFNLTALEHYNFTFYSNGTLSNGTKCWLAFEPYVPPLMHNNASFVNATGCETAIHDLGARGYTGIGCAVGFGLALVFTLTALAKHGRMYLPTEKRFYPIGRRWQWYWASFVCACALISLFLNVDVDRYHIQGLPIIVTSFFWFLMCMGTTAVVWEAVRHWGSWQERQYIDPNPFALDQDDRRAKVEFYLPLWFYFLVWMNFFMVIPRNWNFAFKQRSEEQEAAFAAPGATGPRFKAGAFFLFLAWCTTAFSLWHSIRHYKPRNRGVVNRSIGLIRSMPFRFVLILPLGLSMVAYQALIAFDFRWSVIKANGPLPIIYGWGYGAQLAILFIQAIYGFASPNEDKDLIRQRRERGIATDRELGIIRKPEWWRRVKGEHIVGTFRDRLLKNVHEVGQGQGTGRRAEGEMERIIREDMRGTAMEDGDGQGIELRNVRKGEINPRIDRAGARSIRRPSAGEPEPGERMDPASRDRVLNIASKILFPDPEEVERRDRETEAERARRLAFITDDGTSPPPSYKDHNSQTSASQSRSNSVGTINSITSPPVQVRSMLDL
jgi:hypothetical protein